MDFPTKILMKELKPKIKIYYNGKHTINFEKNLQKNWVPNMPLWSTQVLLQI